MNAAGYYADLTAQYRRYGGRAGGWHYGIWEPDVRTHVGSLLRSNEVLVRGLTIGPSTHLLDVGFGAGGFAVWAARRFGCRVTAISICTEHLRAAETLAEHHGVGSRCAFLAMDMNRIGLCDESFDVVVNQETFCYADDKPGYLGTVLRLLRPGGSWRAVEFSVRGGVPSVDEERGYEAVRDGFHIPSLALPSEVRGALERAGFTDVEDRDLTGQTIRSAAFILARCRLSALLMGLNLDWLVFPRDPRRRANRRGHVRAARAYSIGLQEGYFRYVFHSARKPAAPL